MNTLAEDFRVTSTLVVDRQSQRKIDLAVAALMAFDRAGWYARQGTPMIYLG